MTATASLLQEHREHVASALRRGEHVPDRVLADYPDLLESVERPAVDTEDLAHFYAEMWGQRGPDEIGERELATVGDELARGGWHLVWNGWRWKVGSNDEADIIESRASGIIAANLLEKRYCAISATCLSQSRVTQNHRRAKRIKSKRRLTVSRIALVTLLMR